MFDATGTIELKKNSKNAFKLKNWEMHLLVKNLQKDWESLIESTLTSILRQLRFVLVDSIFVCYVCYFLDVYMLNKQVPEEYKWPLVKKKKYRINTCKFPPKQSLTGSSVVDTVAFYPAVNFAIEQEEYYANNIISKIACSRAHNF